jgi:hypothetical protein
MLDSVRLLEIRRRLEQATPGPWDSGRLIEDQDGDYVVWTLPVRDNQREFVGNVGGMVEPVISLQDKLAGQLFEGERQDAEFIANAPTDIRDLLAEVDRLRAALAFYADDNNYQHELISDGEGGYTDWRSPIEEDDGERANQALGEWEE